MSHRRTVVAGICLLAAASLALGACKSSSSTASGKPAGPAANLSPTEALTAALGKLKGASYDVSLTDQSGSGKGTGSVNQSTNSATLEEKGTVDGQTLDIAATQIATNLWAKIDLGSLNSQLGVDPTKWLLLDQSKLTAKNAKPFDLTGADAFGVTGMLTSVAGLKAIDATHLSGTVDLTKAAGVAAPSSDDLTKAGAAAATTPFTVTLDDQGRPTDVKIDADSFDKSLSQEITFSNFGAASPITAPAASDVVPAPDGIYQLFNQN